MADAGAGGRPNARKGKRRAPRLRVGRVEHRRNAYDEDKGTALDLPAEVAAACDYLRSALRGNARVVTFEDSVMIRQTLKALVRFAGEINQRAAKQANKEGNTPRAHRNRREPA